MAYKVILIFWDIKTKYLTRKVVLILVLISITIGISLHKNLNYRIPIEEYYNQEFIPWGVKSLGIQNFHSEGFTGKGIKVAILDSGVNFHPEFNEANFHEGFNAIDPNSIQTDDYGHGTLVTGVIAASYNGTGLVGVAPDIKIYPVKVLNKFGTGDLDDVIRGIEWCIEHQIDIINMSFAISKDRTVLKDSINKALESGIIIVSSAKNTYGGEVGYPASYEGVISVTAVDQKLKVGNSSPKGKIDFSAPGVDIVSTTFDSKYQYYSGTSVAAPYITGIIAILLQKKPNLNYTNIFDALKEYSIDLGEKEKDIVYGEGIVILR